MKRLFSIGAIGVLLLAVGCSKSDDYFEEPKPEPDDEPTEQLERLCKQANTNIASLQALVSAMQEGDYVDAVTPVMQDGKAIGHTITFEDRDSIAIYHGTGSDTTGNGAMPVIGLRMDEDSVYCWTLNGVWLQESGKKVQVRSTLPQLKLESGHWYFSGDGKQGWQQFGEATDADCDKTFQSLTQDDYNVYILLGSGEKITLRKMSELVVQITEKDTLLQFRDNETRTIHYAITGDTADLVVKVEMQNDDGGYTLRTTPTSKTAGTIEIQAKTPTANRVIVSASDGRQTIRTSIAVSPYPSFDGQTIWVETPGTLSELLADYDQSTITNLRVIGSINDWDISTLNKLPNLSVLDMENIDLKELPAGAFRSNKTLTSVKLPKNLVIIGGEKVFITSHTYRTDGAFTGCTGLTSVVIPNSVTKIGDYAFRGCSGFTGNLTIPNGVVEIGEGAFDGCTGFTGTLTIPSSVTTIGNWAFYRCSGLTGDLTIPESVTTIGEGVFCNCSGFTGNLTIPNSVTTIGNSAFNGCTGLTGNLTISNSVTTIGNYAFNGCTGLTGNLTIPSSVTEIGKSAFEGCKGLTGTLTIPEGVTEIKDGAFAGCTGLTGDLTIPSSVTKIGYVYNNESGAFEGCTGLTSVTIPNSVTTIGSSAFYNCTGLTGNLTIPNSVTTIGSSAFYNCSGLTGNLTIPNSVTTIGSSAFSDCSGLTGDIVIPESVTTIEYRAFYNCSGLTGNLTIPNSVTTIGEQAFYNCSGLTGNLTIPNSVTTIKYGAFYNCKGLTQIECKSNIPPQLGSNVFYNVPTSKCVLYVPTGCAEAYRTAEGWKNYTFKEIIETEF